jgi:hypothetical protein
MANYSVEGKLGTGKTKFCVWMAQQALYAGRRVAGNVDLNLEHLTPYRRSTYMRIPDKPTAFDLNAIGNGNPDSYEEDRNGILLLDELGTWLNARSFQDKDRAALLDWFIHARKHGWDVFFIVQDANMIDKQVREALIEYQCRCLRLDKVRIPWIGRILSLFHERLGYLPRLHLVTSRVGYGAGAVVAERWYFRGADLHPAYDTKQIFKADYAHGTHSVLLPSDFVPLKTWVTKVKEKYKYAFTNAGAFVIGAMFWAFFIPWLMPTPKDAAPVAFTVSQLYVVGTVRFGTDWLVSLSDGTSVQITPSALVTDSKGKRFKNADSWIYLKGV